MPDKKMIKGQVIAAEVNDTMIDLGLVTSDTPSVRLITDEMPEGLEVIRHSASHIMAEAVTQLYPAVKLAIGPSIEDGFYYDFDVANRLLPKTSSV